LEFLISLNFKANLSRGFLGQLETSSADRYLYICLRSKDSTTHHPIYSINGNPINRLQHHKDLAVTFSCDFNWTEHYRSISAKAYQTLGLIKRTFKTNCTQAKTQLYITLVRSQLIYCSQIWKPHLIKDITLLERIQRRATKYILNDYQSTNLGLKNSIYFH